MKTSVSDIVRTERFLRGELDGPGKVVFQARLIVDPELASNTIFHAMVHRLLRVYHRKKLREEIQAVHERLFQDPSKLEFRQSVLKHFKS